MLIVKPDGTLTVTYEYRSPVVADTEKRVPDALSVSKLQLRSAASAVTNFKRRRRHRKLEKETVNAFAQDHGRADFGALERGSGCTELR